MASTGFRELEARLRALGETEPLMRALQISVIHEAQAIVPRKTGFLQRNIVPGRVTRDTARILARTPYAAAIEFGGREYDIVPKRAKVLAWGGARRLTGNLRTGSAPTHFARKVHHPKTRAQPYLRPGAKKAIERGGLRDIVVKTWNGAA